MIQLFGGIDRAKDGKITSEYPAYTFPQQIDNLKEEIGMKSRLLQSGSVDRESEGEYRILLDRDAKRLEEIENSKPKLTEVEKDICAKSYDDLSKGIKENMPTHNDIYRNFVNAHEENRKNSNPCIKVSGKTAEIADANGIRVTSGGEMSRKDASKLYKILGHITNQNTNVERLRKEGFSNAGRPRR